MKELKYKVQTQGAVTTACGPQEPDFQTNFDI